MLELYYPEWVVLTKYAFDFDIDIDFDSVKEFERLKAWKIERLKANMSD